MILKHGLESEGQRSQSYGAERRAMKAEKCKDAPGHLVHCSWSVLWGQGQMEVKVINLKRWVAAQLVQGFECHEKELEHYS